MMYYVVLLNVYPGNLSIEESGILKLPTTTELELNLCL